MAALSEELRAKLPAGDFAVPAKRKLPIHDAAHVAMAWNASDQLSGDERLDAKRAILRKAHSLKVDTKTWHLDTQQFTARAIDFGEIKDHPNRLPFSGVLCFLDEPSDKPVGGAGGKRVIITEAAARESLHTLLGMAVDFKPDFAGHAPKSKIGLITSADIEGNQVKIAGYFWAADYPEEVSLILKDKDKLGFSYECLSMCQQPQADPLVVAACEFTGAAVLYKDKAAYMKTSLAAKADQQEQGMDKDLQDALTAMAASITALPGVIGTTITTALAASATADKQSKLDAAKANAATLRASAQSLKASGLTQAATVLEAEATHIEVFVAKGEVPPAFVAGAPATTPIAASGAQAVDFKPVTDAIGSLATIMTDMKTQLAANSTQVPVRKSLDPSNVAALAKLSLTASGDKKLKLSELNAAATKAQMSPQNSMALKLALEAAGLLDQAA